MRADPQAPADRTNNDGQTDPAATVGQAGPAATVGQTDPAEGVDAAAVTPTGFPAEEARRWFDHLVWSRERVWLAIERSCERSPDAVAIDDGVRRLDYASLRGGVERASAVLVSAGVRAGDRVVVHLPNSACLLEAQLATWRLGAVPVCALPAHGRVDIRHFCELGQAAFYIGSVTAGREHGAVRAMIAQDLPEVTVVEVDHRSDEPWPKPEAPCPAADPDAPTGATDLALLQLSGGTTGVPKLIPRSHADYLYSVRASLEVCDLRGGDVVLVALPMAHNFTLSSPGVLGALLVGATLVVSPDPSPGTCLELVARHGVTHAALVPPLLLGWLDSPARESTDLSSLRTLWVGGSKLSESAARRVPEALGCSLQQVFGMAEGLVNFTRLDDPWEVVVSTQGRPQSPHDEIRVVDDEERLLGPGEVGHLQCRGPYTIRRYHRAPEHDARSFTADGFYRTGDLVELTPTGHLRVVGRAKDQINRGGEKVAPEAVENALLSHEAVHDVSVVGIPDEVLGERIRAYVIPRAAYTSTAGARTSDPAAATSSTATSATATPATATATSAPMPTARDLRAHLRGAGVARFAIPDDIRFVDAFPHTGVGKVDKTVQRG